MAGVYHFFLIFDFLIYVPFIINNYTNQIYFREKYSEIVKTHELVHVILETKISEKVKTCVCM